MTSPAPEEVNRTILDPRVGSRVDIGRPGAAYPTQEAQGRCTRSGTSLSTASKALSSPEDGAFDAVEKSPGASPKSRRSIPASAWGTPSS